MREREVGGNASFNVSWIMGLISFFLLLCKICVEGFSRFLPRKSTPSFFPLQYLQYFLKHLFFTPFSQYSIFFPFRKLHLQHLLLLPTPCSRSSFISLLTLARHFSLNTLSLSLSLSLSRSLARSSVCIHFSRSRLFQLSLLFPFIASFFLIVMHVVK